MKKILFLIMIFAGFVFTSQAQNKTLPIATGNTYVFSSTISSSLGVANFTAADSIAAGRTSYTIQVNSPQKYTTVQDVLIRLDSISTPNMSIQLQGAKFDDSAYSSIGSPVVWTGTTADTTIVITNGTATTYQRYRLVTTRSAGKAAITDFKFKLHF
jgi:hypothetical protein